MPAPKPGDLPEYRDGLLSAENGKNAIHPRYTSNILAKADFRRLSYVAGIRHNSEVDDTHA
jgi:hypothetical protein